MHVLADLLDRVDALLMLLICAVRKVQTRNVHARLNHTAERRFVVARRADGTNDFGFSHVGNVPPYRRKTAAPDFCLKFGSFFRYHTLFFASLQSQQGKKITVPRLFLSICRKALRVQERFFLVFLFCPHLEVSNTLGRSAAADAASGAGASSPPFFTISAAACARPSSI